MTTTGKREILDIVALVENNPLTRLTGNYGSKIIQKIKNAFTTDEEQLFIGGFYCYFNYNPTLDFVIFLHLIWRWLGYSRIEECKRCLVKNFKENVDYKIENFAPQDGGAKTNPVEREQETRGGHNKESIVLTINCFKKLCLKSKTAKADQIHDYYIKLEDLIMELVTEQTAELQLRLQKQDEIILKYNTKKIDINDFDLKPTVYLIDMNEIVDGEKLYKFGNTHDIITRFRTHSNKLKDVKCDIVFKNGWSYLHIDVAIEVETKVKRYIKSENILYEYQGKTTEIFKTNNIGMIEELITKWSDECNEEYEAKKSNEADKVSAELLKQQNDYLVNVNKLLSNGLSYDQIQGLLPPKQAKPIAKVLRKKNPIKEKIDPEQLKDRIKCISCSAKPTPDEMGINEVTGQAYTQCPGCRKKYSDLKFEKGREAREKQELEDAAKQAAKDQIRKQLLSGTTPIKCFMCKENKLPIDIGINRITDQLYKTCNVCRDLLNEGRLKKKAEVEAEAEAEDETEEKKDDGEVDIKVNVCINTDVDKTECSKCHNYFETEVNNLSKTKVNYKRCGRCRAKEQEVAQRAKELLKKGLKTDVMECSTCNQDMPKILTAKKNAYYKICQKCRDAREAAEKKKYEDNKEEICAQKKEYYEANKEKIRATQKEYYDTNKGLHHSQG